MGAWLSVPKHPSIHEQHTPVRVKVGKGAKRKEQKNKERRARCTIESSQGELLEDELMAYYGDINANVLVIRRH